MSFDLVACVKASSSSEFADLRSEAAVLTQQTFGVNREIFAPIYLSNICINDCGYCGFRKSNTAITRRTLNSDEVLSEARYLRSNGVEKLLLLAGEYKEDRYVRMISSNVKRLMEQHSPDWVGVEIAPVSTKSYRSLLKAGTSAVVLFQETYDESAYNSHHAGVGPKGDFSYRVHALERALEAGFTELGLGILIGLGDPWADVERMFRHAKRLMVSDSVRLRFSLPRLRTGASFPKEASGEGLVEKLAVCARLMFPKAEIVLTGRESLDFLLSMADIVTIFGKGGSTIVGGYTRSNAIQAPAAEDFAEGQFSLQADGSQLTLRASLESRGYYVESKELRSDAQFV